MFKILIKKGLKWSWLITASIIISFAIIVSVGRIVFAFASGYKDAVEQLASQFLEHPVKIERVHGSWHGLQPVFKLRNVSILSDDKTEVLTKINKLDMGVDLVASILHRRLEPGEFLVSDLNLKIQQKNDHAYHVNGLSFDIGAASAADMMSNVDVLHGLLLTPGDKILKNITLSYMDKHGEVFFVKKLNAKIVGGVLEHQLVLSGSLEKPTKTPFKIVLKLKGSVLSNRFSAVSGFAKINKLDIKALKNKVDLPFEITAGELDTQVWFSFQHQKLKKLHALANIRHVKSPVNINKANLNIAWNGGDVWDVQLFGNNMLIGFDVFSSDSYKFKHATASFNIAKTHGETTIYCPEFALTDSNLSTSGEFRMHFPSSGSPTLALQAMATMDDVSALKNYLPHKLLKPELNAWLNGAIKSGKITQAHMVFRGPLDKFPFDQSEGVFDIKAQYAKMNVHYRDGWSDIENLYGRLYVDGRSMHIRARHGQIFDEPIRMVTVDIPNLAKPEIRVDGKVNMALEKALAFVHSNPIENTVGRELHGLKLRGPMTLGLKLGIPLHDHLPMSVTGDVTMKDAVLELPDWQLESTNLRGDFHFTEKDFYAKRLDMELLNRPVQLNIQTLHPKNSSFSQTEVYISGNVSALEMANLAAPGTSTLPLGGETTYKAKLLLHRSDDATPDSLTLISDLKGITLEAPQPFGKTASESKYLQLKLNLDKERPVRLNIDYNGMVHGYAMVNPEGVLLDELDLNIETLNLFNQDFKDVRIYSKSDALSQTVSIKSTDISGKVMIPKDLSRDAILANFDYVKLAAVDTKEGPSLKPSDFYPMNLKVENFYYNRQAFGSLILSVTPEENILRINHLELDSPLLHLSSSGHWRMLPDYQETTLSGALRTNSLGKVLHRLDVTDNLVGGKGRLNFTLAWFDSFFKVKPEKLNGRVSLDFHNGHIVKLSQETQNKVGIGRVLNLFSLQSLPKRLTLNFSDLAQKGYAFDDLMGDFMLESGNALTENAYIEGSVAKVSMGGRLGLGDKDYDLKLMITPYVTSSLPVVAALTGGPIAGVATLFAESVVSKAINDITTKAYTVKGPWHNPQIDKVN